MASTSARRYGFARTPSAPRDAASSGSICAPQPVLSTNGMVQRLGAHAFEQLPAVDAGPKPEIRQDQIEARLGLGEAGERLLARARQS